MSNQNVADYLLDRLREWGVSMCSRFPGDGINGILAAWGRADNQPAVRPVAARGDERVRGGRLREVHRPSSASAWPLRVRARSTCSTVCTTRSSTMSRWWRSSGRPTEAPWVAPISRRSTCSACSRTWPVITCQMVTVPEQLPNVLDRAIRIAMAERTPTALIIPADVQELEYSAPTHAFKMVPSSLGIDWPALIADDAAIQRAAEVLNAGSKVAMLVGRRPRRARGAHPGRRPAGRRRRQGAAGQGRAL